MAEPSTQPDPQPDIAPEPPTLEGDMVVHVADQKFEPPNEEKDRRNQTGETAVGAPPPDPIVDDQGRPTDDNEIITKMNLAAQVDWPKGDEPQTPDPEPWRTIPTFARGDLPEPLDANEDNAERNMKPEIIVGAVSADTIPHEPDPKLAPGEPPPSLQPPTEFGNYATPTPVPSQHGDDQPPPTQPPALPEPTPPPQEPKL